MEKSLIDRNIRITISVINGYTYKEAGKSENITSSRVRQLVNHILRISVRPSLLLGHDIPCYYNDIREVRKYSEFWVDRVKAAGIFIKSISK